MTAFLDLKSLNPISLMLGGNVFGWTSDRQNSFAVLDCFVDGGGSLIDTADYYSAWAPGLAGGESERIIGEWLHARGRRDDVVIATKVGLLEGPAGNGLRPRRIAEACEDSLRRLQTDVIDIYFAHIDDPSTPLEDMLAAFDALISSGKVRMIGASNYSVERLAAALHVSDENGLARFQVIEPRYNLAMRREYEGGLEQLVALQGLDVVPFYGLGGGFLTGKYRDRADVSGSPRETWLLPYFEAGGLSVLNAMDAIAAETGFTLAEIAMAWVRSKPRILAPIASATSVAQMEDLLRGLDRRLSPEHITRLDAATAG